ncbi:bifunctional diaminohydroxyphosphoribosylaminopyrimidine deaminase/5-amino-6-(5-phosphoribosylamino)uracil reductase RibD [Zwartia sp.]|uniref:bifunctional diaminohydroxyphosphoribosylaminopyrimidine deaminase/5-amino-6-(5-phosphoribosylamino)uracil reductase RibD n=1 Tax=Zwartia sp. TaxID=2978004 RepID=UPI0027204075|nr:bifunctional diaminohydroxyphosphoribosylaminopyrimidine deaminase/5-amino-6-(5-phosphoribosylamino)uracil reductase RibD [Zwartia sp.]MDO9024725.1 bifunctional diaminohydroxyphosphoribosylaminopyrimidine deaminase/5-amino-6-(5-phosphoribosylamino)uracil reductase RibD [Zwartia sp.]
MKSTQAPEVRNPDQDVFFMRQALALAEQALYVPSPNPRVGCVIVREAQVIGRGATQEVGGHHAEIMALKDMQARGLSAKGATVYITLEPCSHHGRTPPCVEALISAGPARVVFAHFDPNPHVAGRGMRILREAGIEVNVGVCADLALAVNPGFVSRMTRGVPYVWMKVATSLDGRTALTNGVSQWITGLEARTDGHHWRARSCVVLTGIGTVRADDPQMTVRHVATLRQPRRAVIDPGFDISEDAAILKGEGAIIFTGDQNTEKTARLTDRGVQVVYVPENSPGADATRTVSSSGRIRPRVDMRAMMRWLGEHDANEVHIEAGSGLNGALLNADCVDELLVYMAPLLLGEGMGMAQLPTLTKLEGVQRFEFIDMKQLGADIRLRARLPEHWRELMHKIHLTEYSTTKAL